MPTYNFKEEAEVYLVFGGSTIRLDVSPDISFSQTFTDKTYPQKTLHEQHKLHQASRISKANPANFNFEIPALNHQPIVHQENLQKERQEKVTGFGFNLKQSQTLVL